MTGRAKVRPLARSMTDAASSAESMTGATLLQHGQWTGFRARTACAPERRRRTSGGRRALRARAALVGGRALLARPGQAAARQRQPHVGAPARLAIGAGGIDEPGIRPTPNRLEGAGRVASPAAPRTDAGEEMSLVLLQVGSASFRDRPPKCRRTPPARGRAAGPAGPAPQRSPPAEAPCASRRERAGRPRFGGGARTLRGEDFGLGLGHRAGIGARGDQSAPAVCPPFRIARSTARAGSGIAGAAIANVLSDARGGVAAAASATRVGSAGPDADTSRSAVRARGSLQGRACASRARLRHCRHGHRERRSAATVSLGAAASVSRTGSSSSARRSREPVPARGSRPDNCARPERAPVSTASTARPSAVPARGVGFVRPRPLRGPVSRAHPMRRCFEAAGAAACTAGSGCAASAASLRDDHQPRRVGDGLDLGQGRDIRAIGKCCEAGGSPAAPGVQAAGRCPAAPPA